MRSITKILIANRGEIAVRIIRAAREMEIATVAVFSEADRGAMHVRMADEAYCIGPALSSASYLNIEKILETCLRAGAEAIHPGYGFLSENAEFARRTKECNIIFIGPDSNAMQLMGSKLGAKKIARELGVPLVPGTENAVSDFSEALKKGHQIGFPLLIKASAGGGGKGMRLVENSELLEEQLKLAISEASSAFGDGSVFLEKYISSPRHIEIQILADSFGKVLYLFERECSIQRRHQKLIEEAPSVVLNNESRQKMGECAILLASSCSYTGAGTIEFILDEFNNFYFLEMNTRLQVEHPVTELITGIDIVKEQIKIARGEELSFEQKDIQIRGHAIELRICAENPEADFMPDTGILNTYRLPSGPGVRVDNCMEEGMEVPIYYDPLIAKLIVHGSNRMEAIERMKRAISEYYVSGIFTTLDFGMFVMKHEAFISGQFDTQFITKHYHSNLNKGTAEQAKIAALLAASLYLRPLEKDASALIESGDKTSVWKTNRRLK